MKRRGYPGDLSDEQWKRIERLVSVPKPGRRLAKHERLAVLNATCARSNRLYMEIVKRTDDIKGFKVLPRRSEPARREGRNSDGGENLNRWC
jgi:hypothetical protein